MASIKRLFLIGILALGFTLGAAHAQDKLADMDPVTLKLAHVVNTKDGFHIAAERFAELVEKRTDGTIKIKIYPNAQLGDERTLLEGMQIGSVDMGVITSGPVANFVEEIAVFDMPFLFSSREEAYKVLDGPVGQELLDQLERVNLKGLAYAERGFRNLTNSEHPVHRPEDLKGLKIRVMENPVYIDAFRTLGANAVPMAWTEALTAMQQDTIDGQENPVNVVDSFKLYETQKYMSMTRHTYSPALFVMSLRVWKRLPEEARQILKRSAQDAAEYERKMNAKMEEEQLQNLRDHGMEIIMQPDIDAFRKAVKPVYEKYQDRFGSYLDRIHEQL